MRLQGKNIVVTGAGSGIGRAMVRKFVEEGAANVVAVDINADNAEQTAQENGCVAMTADVSRNDDIQRVVEDTESDLGHIDLFCSNAGVIPCEGEQSPDAEWQLAWSVNGMPHVYAARHLVPRMTSRGGGYFLNAASAAGLLNQIGGAAYGVTKHAAVGFGEWLALTYGHKGIKVSLLCPQAVRTAMTTSEAVESGVNPAARAAAGDGMMEPEKVADIVVEGLDAESFLILPHPEVKEYMQRKTSDYDRWIRGMNRLQVSLTGDS